MEDRSIDTLEEKQAPSESSDAESRRRPDRAAAARRPNGGAEMAVCWLEQAVVHAVHLKRRGRTQVIRTETISHPKEAGRFRRSLGKRCTVVALLPRSAYLLKVLEIPRIPSREVPAMLSLEAEAALPPEYGPIEISYRQLPSKNDRCDRYEVYVARREVVGSFLSSLRETGISADLILPSAVAWREVLADNPHAGVLVVDSCCGGICEIALSHEDGTLSVRTVGVAEGKDGHAALEAALTECVRSLAKHSENGSRPVVAGWLGRGPAPVVNGSAVFEPLRPLEDVATKGADQRPLDPAGLLAAAASLTASFDMEALRCSSLLPQEMVQKAARRVLHRNMAGGIAGIIVAMVLAYVGLKVTTNRYWDAGADLGAKIAQIRKEGDSVGRRIAQLAAIRAVRARQADFQDVLTGLYNATPEGITYSNVDLADSDTLRLRGQAESLSLPFLLPQKLEKQPMFAEVVLRDAGQSKRGGGTVTEFRIDCVLFRGPRQ